MKKFRFNSEKQLAMKDAFQKLENSTLKDVCERIMIMGGLKAHGQTFSESGGHGQTHSQTEGGHGQTHGQS